MLINKLITVRNLKIYFCFLVLYAILGIVSSFLAYKPYDLNQSLNFIILGLSVMALIRIKNKKEFYSDFDKKRNISLLFISAILVNISLLVR